MCIILFLFNSFPITNLKKYDIANIIIDKTLTYASETQTLTKTDRRQLNILNGKCIQEFWAQYMTMGKNTGGY